MDIFNPAFVTCSSGCYVTINSTSVDPLCALCPAGNYSDHQNAQSCPACEAGSYNPGGQRVTSCALCSAGSYSGSGQSECTNCTAGTFNPSQGSSTLSACTPCLAGTFNPSTGRASCLSCFAGGYSGSGQSECTPCAAGSYQSSPGQSACTPCAAGSYQFDLGKSVCDPCPAGSYCPVVGLSAGSPCQQGNYCPFGSSAQKECPAGFYCENAATLSPCPQNTYSASTRQTSQSQCSPCPPGEQSGSGSFECSVPCLPSPFNFQTFSCYSTQSKVLVVCSGCVSLFSAVFFPFKMRAIYKKRKAKLEAKGVRPTLKHIIFYRSALARAVSLQPLIDAQGVSNSESASQPPSSKARA